MATVLKKEIYSPFDLSLLSKTDLATVEAWLESKELPFFHITGGHKRVRHTDFEDFLKNKKLPMPEAFKGPMGRYKVLLVEDDRDLLEIVLELLSEERKIETQAEMSGFGAALKIARWHPDLILLDFVMPGMDGFEVCKRLKQDPMTRDIPILATTSLSSVENKRAVMEAGTSAFLGKPFQGDKMIQAVRELLGILPARSA